MSARMIKKEIKQVKETLAKKEGSFAWQMIKRKDKQIKGLIITIGLIASMWMITTLGFVWYLNQYDFVSQDGDGINIVGDNNQEVNQWDKESE